MSDDHKRKISSHRSDGLTPEELQETRYTNLKVLEDFVEPAEIKRRADQHDELWSFFGWIPQIFKNWKKLAVVAVIALLLGGEDLIQSLVTLARGLLP